MSSTGKIILNGKALTADELETSRTIYGVSFNGSSNISNYGVCSTAAATAAKAVSLKGFTLAIGASIKVKFTASNTAANTTLNVNNTGAKPIYYKGAAIASGYLKANRTYEFVYNGTQYDLVGDVQIPVDEIVAIDNETIKKNSAAELTVPAAARIYRATIKVTTSSQVTLIIPNPSLKDNLKKGDIFICGIDIPNNMQSGTVRIYADKSYFGFYNEGDEALIVNTCKIYSSLHVTSGSTITKTGGDGYIPCMISCLFGGTSTDACNPGIIMLVYGGISSNQAIFYDITSLYVSNNIANAYSNDLIRHIHFSGWGLSTPDVDTVTLDSNYVYLLITTVYTNNTGAVYGGGAYLFFRADHSYTGSAVATRITLGSTTNSGLKLTNTVTGFTISSDSTARSVNYSVYLVNEAWLGQVG